MNRKEKEITKTKHWLKTDPQIPQRIIRLKDEYQKTYSKKPNDYQVILAPGRAEVLGGHTDYCGGFTISANIIHNLLILGEARDDNQILLRSLNQNSAVSAFTADIEALESQKSGPGSLDLWSNYPKGVIWNLLRYKVPLQGFNAVIESTIPAGAGVSSSAAIEIAAGKLAVSLNWQSVPDRKLVHICKEAENLYAGAFCGYLDQATVALSDGNWLFIDHQGTKRLPFSYKNIPLDLKNLGISAVVGFDPTMKHTVIGGGFEARKKACDESILILQKLLNEGNLTLRDIPPKKFSSVYNRFTGEIGERKAGWIKHVIYENVRVKKAVDMLEAGEIERFGQIMTDSGKSAIFGYELNEGAEQLSFVFNFVVKNRQELGVLGIRNMGGGFNSTTIALVKDEKLQKYREALAKSYKDTFGKVYELFDFTPTPSVTRLHPEIMNY